MYFYRKCDQEYTREKQDLEIIVLSGRGIVTADLLSSHNVGNTKFLSSCKLLCFDGRIKVRGSKAEPKSLDLKLDLRLGIV